MLQFFHKYMGIEINGSQALTREVVASKADKLRVTPNGFVVYYTLEPDFGFSQTELSMTYTGVPFEPILRIMGRRENGGKWDVSPRPVKPNEADEFVQVAKAGLKLPKNLNEYVTKNRDQFVSDICKAAQKVYTDAALELKNMSDRALISK